jgi:hypothetical protein
LDLPDHPFDPVLSLPHPTQTRRAPLVDHPGLAQTQVVAGLRNTSVVGRLLEEISWEGANVRAYRKGGRGRENVLTAEVLWPLSLLPRDAFLGGVIAAAHGAETARAVLSAEAEKAEVVLLPDEFVVGEGKFVVQPDATIASDGAFVLVEAKRIRRSSFQPHQLAREFATVLQEAGDRTPLLLLILGDSPPVPVQGRGRIEIADAITGSFGSVLDRTARAQLPTLDRLIRDHVAWITWSEIEAVVKRCAADFADAPRGLSGTIDRLCTSLISAIAWHS